MFVHEFIFVFILSIFFDVRENVIHVHENEYIKILMKRLVDVRLKARESVHQIEKHNIVLKMLKLTSKRCFLFVFFFEFEFYEARFKHRV